MTVPVIIGPSDLTHTVILAGLEQGQDIVTGPFKQLVGLKEAQVIEDESKQVKPGAAAPPAPKTAEAAPKAGAAS